MQEEVGKEITLGTVKPAANDDYVFDFNPVYPIMVTGFGNTYKTTIALHIAIRDYCQERASGRATKAVINIVSQEITDEATVATIIERNIFQERTSFKGIQENENIEFRFFQSLDKPLEKEEGVMSFLIIDDLFLIHPSYELLMSDKPSCLEQRFPVFLKKLEENEIKTLAVVHMGKPFALTPSDKKPEVRIFDHGVREHFKNFVLTSPILDTDKIREVSSPLNVVFHESI